MVETIINNLRINNTFRFSFQVDLPRQDATPHTPHREYTT